MECRRRQKQKKSFRKSTERFADWMQCIILSNKKESERKLRSDSFGWGSWIRTNGMQESKSCALPLGDTPINTNGVDNETRTHGLQSHNLAL